MLSASTDHYLIRFHLGRGEQFNHWQVKDSNGNVSYYNPDDASLIMKNCILKNQKGAAQKIFNGENKRPCAWVKCETLEIVPKESTYPMYAELAYNPRLSPNWVAIIQGEIVANNYDKRFFPWIHSYGRKLYTRIELINA